MNSKKILLFLLLSSSNIFAADYEYDNMWYAIYKGDNNVYQVSSLQGTGFKNVPGTDCQLGQEIHEKEDLFTRTISCLEMEIDKKFICKFDPDWKVESGEKDEYATTCRKEYKNLTLVMKIRRYPNTKYWNKKIMKEAIKAANIPEVYLNKH